MKKTKWIVGLSIAGIMALSGTAFALTSGSAVTKSVGQTLGFVQPSTLTLFSPNNNPSAFTITESDGYGGSYGIGGYGGGYGMMGGYGGGYGMMGGYGGGYGMMGGYGGGYGMMGGYGGGYGMMGGYGGYGANGYGVAPTNGEVITSDQAIAIVKDYSQKLNQDVVVAKIHEFTNGYEVELKEGATGAKAYDVMVYKNGGTQMSPKIMWNTKYGYTNWGNNGAITVSEEQATKSAQEFVSNMGQEYSIGKPELAPGYYEFIIQKDGKDYAELDVNGYTGQVWLQNWQGPILNTIDVK